MSAPSSSLPTRPYRRIATEEAFSPPEILEIHKRILAKDDLDVQVIGLTSLASHFENQPSRGGAQRQRASIVGSTRAAGPPLGCSPR